MNNFIVRIIFLCFPGIIALKIYRQINGKKTLKDWEDFIEILLFSVFGYLFLYFINEIFIKIKWSHGSVTFFNAIVNEKQQLLWPEIFYATIISIILAFIISYFNYRKSLNKLALKLKLTKRYGDEDVWNYLFNSDNIEWVFVRDIKADRCYFGYVPIFSDDTEKRELVIRNVKVYRNIDNAYLYDIEAIYISREHDEISIEIPQFVKEKDNGKKQ